MTRYTVTQEIKTSWRKKLLRKIGLEELREEFDIISKKDFQVGDIATTGTKKLVVKILAKYER